MNIDQNDKKVPSQRKLREANPRLKEQPVPTPRGRMGSECSWNRKPRGKGVGIDRAAALVPVPGGH